MVQHAFDLAFGKRIALGNVGDGVKEIVPPDKNIAGIGLFLPEKAAYDLAELLKLRLGCGMQDLLKLRQRHRDIAVSLLRRVIVEPFER